MTAVIAVNDMVAVGVVKCLNERGYRIPQDISVVGCDNLHEYLYGFHMICLHRLAACSVKLSGDDHRHIIHEQRKR